MRAEESRSELGTVRIHKKVIASIASIAAMEIEGIKRVGGDIKTNICELFNKKSLAGIKVDAKKFDEDLDVLSRHISNSYKSMDGVKNRFTRLFGKLEKVQEIEPEAEKPLLEEPPSEE